MSTLLRLPLSTLIPAALLVSLFTLTTAATTDSSKDNNDSDSDDGIPGVRGLSTFDIYDALAMIFISIGLAVSAAGGVGGGTILVPALVIIMGFDMKRASPISNMAIVGGAIANAWFNLRKRHPAADRPLIDSDLALAMIPLVMGGAVIGTVFAKLLPGYFLSLLFVLVLVLSGTRTISKGMKMHRAETRNCKVQVQELTSVPTSAKVATVVHQSEDVSSPSSCGFIDDTEDGSACGGGENETLLKESGSSSDGHGGLGEEEDILADIIERERHFSLQKQGVIVVCYLGIVAASIGGKAVKCGGVAYWLLLLFEVPWVLAFGFGTAVYLSRQHGRKLSVNYVFAKGDVQWTQKTVIRFPLACGGAGLIAGLFGVGGGLVTGPLMIEMGVVPEVASATTALMVLYSAAAATVKFAVFNMISWDWAVLLCVQAFIVTTIAQVVILGFVRRTGRQSVVVLCIGATICIGAATMTYQAIKSTIDNAGKPFEANVCK